MKDITIVSERNYVDVKKGTKAVAKNINKIRKLAKILYKEGNAEVTFHMNFHLVLNEPNLKFFDKLMRNCYTSLNEE